MKSRWLWIYGGAFSLCVWCASARAQQSQLLVPAASEAPARAAFLEGKTAFEAGHFAEALDRFRVSYRLSGQPALQFNIGLAADRLREDAIALQAFERYLRENPDGEDRPEVQQRVEALRASMERKRALSAERAASDANAKPTHVEPMTAHVPASEAHASSSVFERWWFWTAVGVVVAGGIGAAVLLTADAQTETGAEPRTGIVVMTLGSEP
jgi:tetratricopeptide (TPR) repeat protein